MTTIDLAVEAGVTPKSVRLAIKNGYLRATRKRRGREQNTFVVSRADADVWLKGREAKKGGKSLPPPRQAGIFRDREKESFGYFRTRDDEHMLGMDTVERLKRAALNGNQRAKEQLQQPWEDGGIGLRVWQRAGIGGNV